jgi:hypothetical protein
VAECIADPPLLEDIADGLKNADAALVGDCAEVLTHVASVYPERVAPYAEKLIPLLSHKTTRVRWEAMHALALIATHIPDTIATLLPQLQEMISADKSTIVRDHAVDTVGNYAGTSEQAAAQAFPILAKALRVWDSKHAARALNGLSNVALNAPGLQGELLSLAQDYVDHYRGVVKKAARRLVKTIESK